MPKPQGHTPTSEEGPNCRVEEVVGSKRKEIADVLDIDTAGGQWGYITNRGELQEFNSETLTPYKRRGGA